MMIFMKKITALLFCIVSLAACSGNQQERSIFGSWQMLDGQSHHYGPSASTPLTWTFNEDSTFAVTFVTHDVSRISSGVDTVSMPGTYAMAGDKMIMNFDTLDLSNCQKEVSMLEGYTVTFKVILNGSNLELVEGNGGTMKLKHI